MTTALKTASLTFFLVLIGLTVAIFINPEAWLSRINPVKATILKVDMQVSEHQIEMDFDVLISNAYFLEYALDSIRYEISLDTSRFSTGRKTLNGAFSKNRTDTLSLPLSIDRKVLKNKMNRLQQGDSTKLNLEFRNYLNLPLLGRQVFNVHITRSIPAPDIPDIEVMDVEKIHLERTDALFRIYFRIINSNNYALEVSHMEADIIFDGLFTGHATSDSPVNILAGDTSYFSAHIDINELELFRDGIKVVFQPRKDWPYNIDARLEIKRADEQEMILQVNAERTMQLMGRRK